MVKWGISISVFKLSISLLAFIVPLSYMLPNSYLTKGDIGWEEVRLQGASLDGHWYFQREGYQGCFEQFLVYEIADGQFYQHFDGYRQVLPISAKNDGKNYIEMRMQPGVTSKYYFEDKGQELHLYRLDVVADGKLTSTDENEALLMTCDNPTINGTLLSFYYRVFDPMKTVKNISRNTKI